MHQMQEELQLHIQQNVTITPVQHH